MLADLLRPDRAAVLKRWSQRIMETYPPDTASFLGREKDQFLNPVGQTIARECESILDELLGEMDAARLSRSLDNLIGIRAVQEFSASEAVGFLFLLKGAVRDGLRDRELQGGLQDDLLQLEARVDRLALAGFDIYSRRRERIFEISRNEARRRAGIRLERAGRLGVAIKGAEEPPDGKRGNGR